MWCDLMAVDLLLFICWFFPFINWFFAFYFFCPLFIFYLPALYFSALRTLAQICLCAPLHFIVPVRLPSIDPLKNPTLLHLVIDQEEKDIHHELSQCSGDALKRQPSDSTGVAKQIGTEQDKIADRFDSDASFALKTPIPVEGKIQYTGSDP